MFRTRQGDVVYRFRRRWRNGKQFVVMDPLTFLARLGAQIPPPRWHVLSYYGVLGAAAARRDEIVPQRIEESAAAARRCKKSVDAERAGLAPEATHDSPRTWPERVLSSDVLRRVFFEEVLSRPCGGRRTVLSMIFNPVSIERVLRHLGLPHEAVPRAPPRPIQVGLPFSA